MIKVGNSVNNNTLLDKIPMEEYHEGPVDNNIASYHDPQDIVLSHQYITSEVKKFGIDITGCSNCSALTRHLVDPRSLYDTLSQNKIEWIKLDNSQLICPYPQLKNPIYDPSNINHPQNPNRPKGIIRVTRLFKDIPDVADFSLIAKQATCSVLRSL